MENIMHDEYSNMCFLTLIEQISSASNCTDYQSRRLGIRYRPSPSDPSPPSNSKKGKGSSSVATRFVHTLNATACAVPRMIVCLLENFQQEDGSVLIPEPLRPFMGALEVLSPKGQWWCFLSFCLFVGRGSALLYVIHVGCWEFCYCCICSTQYLFHFMTIFLQFLFFF